VDNLKKLNNAYQEHIDKIKLQKMWQDLINLEDRLPKDNPYGTKESIEHEKENLITLMVYGVCSSFAELGGNPKFKPKTEYTKETRDILNAHADIIIKIKELAGSKDAALFIVRKHRYWRSEAKDENSMTLLSMVWDILEHWHNIKDNDNTNAFA